MYIPVKFSIYSKGKCMVLILILTPDPIIQMTILQTYGVTKNNPLGNFLTIYWIQTQYILLLREQVLTILVCIKRVRLNWNLIVNDVQSASYSSHGAPCPARDLFSWLNTRVKVHISLWTIREYLKIHFRYLSLLSYICVFIYMFCVQKLTL